MSARFEILDWQDTPMGQLSLRRRHEPALDVEIYEVQLNDEHLMSSLFTVSESELARLGVGSHEAADELAVLVGGLGLGYTAITALAEPRVGSVTVVEALEPVIGWHRRRLLPDSAELAGDPRCRLVHDDFFALVAEQRSATRYDVVLLDIDHTPDHVLHPSHAAFYSPLGLGRLSSLLRDDGVFALWSDDPPEERFLATLGEVFATTSSHVVTFPNPHTRGVSSCTVYVARNLRPVHSHTEGCSPP
jgi:spermidine synthase